MLYINHLTNDPQQQTFVSGIPGLTITMNLRFMPRIQRWIMDIITPNWAAYGLGVTTHPNMLRQYRNQIPFGICCIAASGLDPYTINDFANQTANLYLLDSDDVAEIESGFFA